MISFPDQSLTALICAHAVRTDALKANRFAIIGPLVLLAISGCYLGDWQDAKSALKKLPSWLRPHERPYQSDCSKALKEHKTN
jgi:hypothetical protein